MNRTTFYLAVNLFTVVMSIVVLIVNFQDRSYCRVPLAAVFLATGGAQAIVKIVQLVRSR